MLFLNAFNVVLIISGLWINLGKDEVSLIDILNNMKDFSC